MKLSPFEGTFLCQPINQRKHGYGLALDRHDVVLDQVSSSQVSGWLSTLWTSISPGFTRSKYSCLKVRQDCWRDLKLVRRNTETSFSKHLLCSEAFNRFFLCEVQDCWTNGLTVWIKGWNCLSWRTCSSGITRRYVSKVIATDILSQERSISCSTAGHKLLRQKWNATCLFSLSSVFSVSPKSFMYLPFVMRNCWCWWLKLHFLKWVWTEFLFFFWVLRAFS